MRRFLDMINTLHCGYAAARCAALQARPRTNIQYLEHLKDQQSLRHTARITHPNQA